jgi:hypothetical protein
VLRRKTMKNIFPKATALVLVSLTALWFSGCYKDIRDYCEEMVDCEGGNDEDEKACVEELKGERKAAREYDCRDEFDDMLECFVDHGDCEDGDYGDYFSIGETCSDEQEDLWDCEDDASGFDNDN